MNVASEQPVMFCAEHPSVETVLRCSRCEKPICPKCLVFTPVGARCRECARVQAPPVYTVGTTQYLRALGAGLGSAVLIGLVWAFIPAITFFLLWTVLFVGYAIGEAISRAANRKRGPGLMTIAVFSVLLAFMFSRLARPVFDALIRGISPDIIIGQIFGSVVFLATDIVSLLFIIVGCVVAAFRVR